MTDYFVQEDAILAFLHADKLDTQALGEDMELVASEPGGLTPRTFQMAVANPSHRAHRHAIHYNWDDRACGLKYRDGQSRALFRVVWTVEPLSDKGTRAFVSLRSDRPAGYQFVGDILSSSELTERLLDQALAELETFERKYRCLQEIVQLVAAARAKIAARRGKSRRSSARPHGAHP
jgi:hypothetical protein